MTRTIYLAYHKPAPMIESPSLKPIHVGRSTSAPFQDLIGDDTGDHISEKNGAYCELTALYWIWKNDHHSAYKGLMHYRRLLDFTKQFPNGPTEQFIGELNIPEWIAETEHWLSNQLANYDIILPRKHLMGLSIRENYSRAHNIQDLELAGDAIAELFPEYTDTFNRIIRSREIRLGNICLMRADIFDRYCAWLFAILERVEQADVPRDHYSVYQHRYIGFLAERLFTVFIEHEISQNPDLKLYEAAIVNLSQSVTTPFTTNPALNDPDQVNIAFSADRAYLPHTAAMLRSLLDHANNERRINLFFLHNNVEPQALLLLESVTASNPNVTFQMINVGRRFSKSYRSESRAPSNATYNRFLLFDLLPTLEKLLYIDVDVIVREDICKLYDVDLGDAKVGAVTDWIMTRTLTGKVTTSDPNVPDLYAYQREKLGMKDAHINRYFNAGVLLFNFAAMDNIPKVSSDLMTLVDRGGMLFRDQDILNSYFKDDLQLLDPRWNVFNSAPEAYSKVPYQNHKQAMDARKDPWIVHYADGAYKPWNNTSVLMAHYYWSALLRTPFYSEVIAGLSASSPRGTRPSQKNAIVKVGQTIADKVPILRKPLLRLYALLRSATAR